MTSYTCIICCAVGPEMLGLLIVQVCAQKSKPQQRLNTVVRKAPDPSMIKSSLYMLTSSTVTPFQTTVYQTDCGPLQVNVLQQPHCAREKCILSIFGVI